MKNQFKKSLMALAAGAALAGTSVQLAHANSVLFPYFTTLNGAQSYLTLATGPNSNPARGPNGPVPNIHYVFSYFNRGANGTLTNTNSVTVNIGGAAQAIGGPVNGGTNYGGVPQYCVHYDVFGTMTANDLVQQAILNTGNLVGPDLFDSNTTTSTAAYMPVRADGYLVVSDNSPGNVPGQNQAFNNANQIVGSMVIYDPSTGMVVSYKGISGVRSTTEGDFSNLTDTNFRLTWYPYSIANTSWYYIVTGNMNPAIAAGLPYMGGGLFRVGSIFNRNELPVSGALQAPVACAGQLTLNPAQASAGMLPLLGAQAYGGLGNGGLLNLTFVPGNTVVNNVLAATSTGVVLAKVETTSALGPQRTLVTIENNLSQTRGPVNAALVAGANQN